MKERILLEYAKCQKSSIYAIETYLQTYDNTISQYVPFKLFPDQIELVSNYEKYEENIAKKYRQAGVSTVTAAWASKKISFARSTSPEKILIIANKLDTSIEMANKIKEFTRQWPDWLGVEFDDKKNSQKHYKLKHNNSEVKAVATSKDALRGFTPTVLIMDEAAFIEADDDFWAACMASLSTGGKIIVISTPNGYDPIYYTIYNQAIRNMNEFKITELIWWKDPRYSSDLKMVKTDDIIKFIREHHTNDDSKYDIIDFSHVEYEERDFSQIKKLIDDGYSPYSTWFENMVKKLKYDKRKVAQEIESSFIGSGDNVFDAKLLEEINKTMLCEPEAKLMGNALWIWKDPVPGHKYIMAIDVSRGDSEDFTTFQIIDFDNREQVVEYLGKVPPDVIAEIAYKWATMYSCFIVIDITGGMGVATSRKLVELGYKNLYYDNQSVDVMWNTNIQDKIPGISYNNKRVQIIASFEEAIRNGFRIYSQRLHNEMGTFIYRNGKPDHQKGHHDDLIQGMAMATYVAENSFSKLQKVDEQTKVLLDLWTVNDNDNLRPPTSFEQYVPNHMRRPVNRPTTPKDYQDYLWLFGKIK